tara:strand:- start:255 stop:890 length:636 start_codon:yes stop_codon:yes gene_type:complete
MSRAGRSNITWIKSGTLTGKPTVVAGCETLCGTKQYWKIGVTPELPNKRTRFLTELYSRSFIISLNAKDTSGGACVSSWSDVEDLSKHSITVKVMINDNSEKINEYIVFGIEDFLIPITEYGKYTFEIETREYGLDCKKPKNTSKVNLWAMEDGNKNNNNTNEGNGELEGGNENSNNTLEPLTWGGIEAYKFPLAMLIGAGTLLTIISIKK